MGKTGERLEGFLEVGGGTTETCRFWRILQISEFAVFFLNLKREIDYPPVSQGGDGKQPFLMADTALIQLQMLVLFHCHRSFGCVCYLGRGHLNRPRFHKSSPTGSTQLLSSLISLTQRIHGTVIFSYISHKNQPFILANLQSSHGSVMGPQFFFCHQLEGSKGHPVLSLKIMFFSLPMASMCNWCMYIYRSMNGWFVW